MRSFTALYALLIVVFAVYGIFWGDYAYKGWIWNIGRGFIWPVDVALYIGNLIKAALMWIVGAVVMLGFLLFIAKR